MRPCAINTCEADPFNGALLCKRHQREALRLIRRQAAEREEMLREEDGDSDGHGAEVPR